MTSDELKAAAAARASLWTRLWQSRRRWLPWLRVLVSVGLLAIVVGLVIHDWDKLVGVDWELVPLAWLLMLLSTVVKALRWSLLVRQSRMNLPFRRLLGTYLVGAFFSTVLPTSVGGDAVRAVDTAAHTGRVADSTSSVLIERGIGLLSVIGAGSIFALFMEAGRIPRFFLLAIHGMFVAGIVGLVVLRVGWFMEPIAALLNRLRLPKIAEQMCKLQASFSAHLARPGVLLAMVALSIVANALTMGAIYLVLMAITTPIPLTSFVPMIALATAAELVPISISALGVKESAYIFFLGLVRVDQGPAGVLAIIMRVLTWGLALVGGLVYMVRSVRARAGEPPDDSGGAGRPGDDGHVPALARETAQEEAVRDERPALQAVP